MKKISGLFIALLLGALPLFFANAEGRVWKYVAAGDGSTYAIDENGSLYSWGWNESGQLGIDNPELKKVSIPQDISGGYKWKFVVSGQAYTFFIREDGTLWTAGQNESGVSGVNDGAPNHKVLTQVGTDNDWKYVAATRFFGRSVMAIKTDGTLWAWGDGSTGTLGLGNYNNKLVPTQVGTDTDWAQVSVGSNFTIALKTDGTMWGWGWNQRSELLDSETHVKTPKQLGTDSDWREVFAVASACYGIKNDGSLYVWGYAEYDVLGINDPETIQLSVPTKVSVVDGYVHSISGSEYSRVVMVSPDGTKDGERKILSWGTNCDGALGDGTGVSVDNADNVVYTGVPVEPKFEEDMTFTQITSGQEYTIVLNSEGELWGWGRNRGGQLGNYCTEDMMTYATSPIRVAAEDGGDTPDDVFTFGENDIPASLTGARKIVLTGEWSTSGFVALTSGLGNNSGFPPAGNSVLEEVDMNQATIADGTTLYVPFGFGNCGVFQGCRALKVVTMPADAEAAKFASLQSAFQNCSALEAIDLSGCTNITSLTDAFFGCELLKRVNLSGCDKLTGTESMFDKCTSLEEVIFPATITLEKYVFGECLSLRTIDWSRFSGTEAPVMPNDFFQYITDLKVITLIVPADAYDSFAADDRWNALTLVKYGTSSISNIDLNNASTSFEIYSIDGRFVRNGRDLTEVPSGVYVIKSFANGKTCTIKVTKR